MPDFPVKDLKITIHHEGVKHEIMTFRHEYRSLMHLITDKLYPEEFGECLGMGKCGTCRVEIISSEQDPNCFERNETVTLSRSGAHDETVRLSCQIVLDELSNYLEVRILN